MLLHFVAELVVQMLSFSGLCAKSCCITVADLCFRTSVSPPVISQLFVSQLPFHSFRLGDLCFKYFVSDCLLQILRFMLIFSQLSLLNICLRAITPTSVLYDFRVRALCHRLHSICVVCELSLHHFQFISFVSCFLFHTICF